MENPKQVSDLAPAAVVCAKFGVVEMTLRRWMADPRLNFPKPIRINRRRYWRVSEIEEFIARKQDATTGEAGGAA